MRLSFTTATAFAAWQFSVARAFPGRLLGGDRLHSRQGPLSGLDVKDLEWVQKWAAIGDSYSAGIGAGKKLSDSGSCSRYDNSYPMLLQTYEEMPSPAPAMEYLSCSGATSPQILDQQVSKLGTGYDLITVSAGGNDVGLADVLNHCIFQWMPGRDKNCDDQLAKTEDLVKNTLPKNLDALAAGLKGKTASLRKVFWTGYARFFDEATPDCDQVTWSFFYNLGPVFQKQYLTQARRKRMNDLTVAVNAAIRDAVGRAGSDFVFVDYDQYYDDLGGRFCESGVEEPDGNRQGLLFFEWGTNDDDTTLPSKRDIDYMELDDSYLENVYQPRDFEDDDAELVARQASSGNVISFEDTIMDMIIQTKTDNTSLLIALPDHSGADPVYRGRTTLSKSDFVSDSILRVFHPRPGGHALIANLLIWNLASQQANSPDGPGGYKDEVGPAANEGCTLPVNEPAAPTSTVQVNQRI